MLILPPGHHKEITERRQFSRRERGFMAGAGALVAALVVAVVISIGGASPTSAHGCVYVTIGSSTGALVAQGCGARARSICAEVSVPGVYAKQTIPLVAAQCRLAGLPTRAPA
jgi:hypothetical protein